MKDLKRIIINSASGGAGYVLPMLLNMVTTPYILAQLGEEAYGLQVLANVIIGYLVVADMGLDIPITHQVAQYEAGGLNAGLGKFISATLKIYLLIGLIGMLALILLTDRLTILLSIPADMLQTAILIFYLCGIGFFGSTLNMWGRAVFNGLHRYDITNGLFISTNILGLLSGIILIKSGYGVVGFFCARISAFGIIGLVYIVLVSKYITSFSFKPFVEREIWHSLKKNIGYGFILRISGMVFLKMDQALISAWVGISSVSVYSIPILIVTAISGLLSSIVHFSFPMVTAMSLNSSEKIEDFFIKITKFTVVLATLLFPPFFILGDRVVAFWINGVLAQESDVVFKFLLISFYINSCLTVGLNSFVMGTGQLKYFTYYALVRGLSLFLGFLFLIGIWGIEGAGVSYIIASGVDFVYTLWTLKVKFNFNVTRILRSCYTLPWILGIVLASIMWFIRHYVQTVAELVFCFAIYGFSYLVLAYFIGVVNSSEKALIKILVGRVTH